MCPLSNENSLVHEADLGELLQYRPRHQVMGSGIQMSGPREQEHIEVRFENGLHEYTGNPQVLEEPAESLFGIILDHPGSRMGSSKSLPPFPHPNFKRNHKGNDRDSTSLAKRVGFPKDGFGDFPAPGYGLGLVEIVGKGVEEWIFLETPGQVSLFVDLADIPIHFEKSQKQTFQNAESVEPQAQPLPHRLSSRQLELAVVERKIRPVSFFRLLHRPHKSSELLQMSLRGKIWKRTMSGE